MFIVTNRYFSGSNEIAPGYFADYDEAASIVTHEDALLLFDGYLYQDTGKSIDDIFEWFRRDAPIKKFKQFKGKYAGVFIGSKKHEIRFFNDQLGLQDLFYYQRNDEIIVSNKLIKILLLKKFTYSDMDEDAMNDFLVFGYPLFERTFVKNLRWMPLASIGSREREENYWQYTLTEDEPFDEKTAIEKLHHLLIQSFTRIKEHHGENVIYGLGLSGGYDSRLVAYYAQRENLQVKTFTLGDQGSDAQYIARRIAQKLSLDHQQVSISLDFVKYAEKISDFAPMRDILSSWFYAQQDRLPKFDALLTGFNGDNQFGSHLVTNSVIPDDELVELLIIKYGLKKVVLSKKNQDLLTYWLSLVGGPTINKWECFNYNFRQLKSIKSNPLFNFLGQYNGTSPFEDIDLVEFLLTIPYEWKKNRKFFMRFIQTKTPELLRIRAERGLYSKNAYIMQLEKTLRYFDTKVLKTNLLFRPSHKQIEQWLRGNDFFRNYANQLIEKNGYLGRMPKVPNLSRLLEEIYRGSDKQTITLFSRLMTIRYFVNRFIKN